MTNQAKEKAVAFIVVRLTSARLPEKQLQKIGGKSILSWIVERLENSGELDEFVLATVAEPENEPLRQFAEGAGIPLFWYEGDVNHVTTRLTKAAEAFDADICVLISGDCPLIDEKALDHLLRGFRESTECDFVRIGQSSDSLSPMIEGIQIARRRAWVKADELSDRPELKEHQFPVIYKTPGLFKEFDGSLPRHYYARRHRMSVDTAADLEFFNTVYDRLNDSGLAFDILNLLSLLEREPELKRINKHVHQRKLVERVKKIAFIADSGGEYGYGHLMRSMELALQTVERLGWPADFIVDDEKSAEMAASRGFKVIWGALGRPPGEGGKFSGQRWEGPSLPAEYDGVVVDISARRSPEKNWRKALCPDRPVLVIDRADAPALEGDLIVFPGVHGRGPDQLPPGAPEMISGLEHVILRREVRRIGEKPPPKDLDVVAYLYDEGMKRAVTATGEKLGLKVHVVEGFTEGFHDLLNRAKIFLSGYGNAFYEAAYLGARPIVNPLSPLHQADARAFYGATGIAPLTVVNETELEGALESALAEQPLERCSVADGTANIVAALERLLK